MDAHYIIWSRKQQWKYKFWLNTFSLCSFLLIMTAVICWSIKIRIVQSRAGITAAITVHQGLGPKGVINQPRSSLVGYKNSQAWPVRSVRIIYISTSQEYIQNITRIRFPLKPNYIRALKKCWTSYDAKPRNYM